MKRMTVLIDDDLQVTLERVARYKGTSKAWVLREALWACAAHVPPSKPELPGFAGSGRSAYKGSPGKDAEKLIVRGARRKWLKGRSSSKPVLPSPRPTETIRTTKK
jgi:hypothetical protein